MNVAKITKTKGHSRVFDDDVDMTITTNDNYDEKELYDVDEAMKKTFWEMPATGTSPDDKEYLSKEEVELLKKQARIKQSLNNISEPVVQKEEPLEEEEPLDISEPDILPEEQPIEIEFGERSFSKMIKQHEQAYKQFKKLKEATNFRTILSISSKGMSVNFTWDIPKKFKTEGISL